MVRRIFSQKLRFLLLGVFSFMFSVFGVGYVFDENSVGSLFGSQQAHAQKDGDPGCGCAGGGGGGSSSNTDGAQVL